MLRGEQGKRNGTNITIEFKKGDGDWCGAPSMKRRDRCRKEFADE
jgi:hypothetical protein